MSYIAGAFTATYAASSIGGTRDGFHLRETFHQQHINSDEYGDAPVSAVQQGVEVLVTLDYIEYDSIRAAIIKHAGTQGSAKANVGKTQLSLAAALVLTAVAGTPAAGIDTTYTFHKAIIEGDVETLLSSKLRSGPVTFRAYPDPANSNKAYTKV